MTERPIDLLLACHERIRRYCGGLKALCEVEPRDPRTQATAQACHRYFGQALHLHGQDEDSSVLPRLQEHLTPEQQATARRLAEEHREIDARTPAVLRALEGIAALPVAQRRGIFAPYWTLLLSHIETEEQSLFPSLAKLSEPQQAQIVVEIRARRRSG